MSNGNEVNVITDVSSYLSRIKEFEKEIDIETEFFVFRGESDIYPKPCKANIFRKGYLDKNEHFERNVFDTMKQERLSHAKSYLHNAIDAQHGEFPSRLLDVSYNCLMALYFAVTPYYHKKENSKDDLDGMVYVFRFDEVYSPYSEAINGVYNSLICKTDDWLTSNILFSKNHKFIDHAKLNNRIIAQQGAFVLFQGNDDSEISKRSYWGIKVPANAKAKIRQELELYFGIHTGSVYPEITNLEKSVCNRSIKINNSAFSIETELRTIISNLEKDLKFYIGKIVKEDDESFVEYSRLLEKELNSYRIGFIELALYIYRKEMDDKKDLIDEYFRKYNYIIDKYGKIIEYNIENFAIDENLKLKENSNGI